MRKLEPYVICANDTNKPLQMWLAKTARSARLFAPFGGLGPVYSDMLSGFQSFPIAVVFENGKPIGCGILHKHFWDSSGGRPRLWIFVRRTRRREGFGRLIAEAFSRHNYKFTGHTNCSSGSIEFFQKCKLLRA